MPVASMKASDVDVLIVGAGPAGLMCANALAKVGVKVRIIDKRWDLLDVHWPIPLLNSFEDPWKLLRAKLMVFNHAL